MKITDGEKLILLMLSEIYEKLEISGEIDPEFIKSSILDNQTWGIPWKYAGIPFEQQETPEIVKKTLDILDMWSFIEHSYEELGNDEKEFLKEAAKPFGDNPKFLGFDGNNEAEYMSAAIYIINDLERFETFKGRSLNSHAPSLDTYNRMLPAFEKARDENPYNSLTKEQITKILKEINHPSTR